MRKIKCRAWDKVGKKFLFSEKQEFICTTHSDGFGVTIPYHKTIPELSADNFDEDCFDWADADLLMGRYELEQFTGLYDEKGSPIYENDTVRVENEKMIVCWEDDLAEFALKDKKGYFISSLFEKECRVIGTIHDKEKRKGRKKHEQIC